MHSENLPSSDSTHSKARNSQNTLVPLSVLTTLFFVWGFITVLNDILIPYLKGVFELSIFQATLVQFAFFGAYFIGSLAYFLLSSLRGDPIAKIGYKNGIILGLLISMLGCALFFPAAAVKSYAFFLMALFTLGLGFTLLQIAANPYVALLGKPETASSRLNLAQGFNSLGTTISPIVGGFLIFEYFGGAHVEGADSVKMPYLILAFSFLVLAICMSLIKLPKFTEEEKVERGAAVLRFPHLLKGMGGIFMYVGAEVTIGSLLISYIGLENIAGFAEITASKFLSFYWGGAMIGRFLGAVAMSDNVSAIRKQVFMLAILFAIYLAIYVISGIGLSESLPFLAIAALNLLAFYIGKGIPGRTLAIFGLSAIMLLIIAIFFDGKVAMWSLLGIGLFNSIMWSNIFTLAIAGLGKYVSQGSSLLVMAILGGALVPPIQGLIAGYIGLQYSFIVPAFCYAYIIYYGAKGYKIKDR